MLLWLILARFYYFPLENKLRATGRRFCMLATCFQQDTKLAGVASGDDSARGSQPSENCLSVLLLVQWQSLGRFLIPGDACQEIGWVFHS